MQSLHFETLPEDLIFELLLILKSNKGFSESCEYVNKIYLKYVEKLSLGILNNFDYAYPKDIFFLDKYREMKKEGYTGVYDNLVNYFQNTHIYWRSSISIIFKFSDVDSIIPSVLTNFINV